MLQKEKYIFLMLFHYLLHRTDPVKHLAVGSKFEVITT